MDIHGFILVTQLVLAIASLAARAVELAIRIAELRRRSTSEKEKPGE